MYFIRRCLFLKCSVEGLLGGGGGVLLVHNEIHYVPIGDGWEEVLIRNVLHYVPVHTPITLSKSLSHKTQSILAGLEPAIF
jgi:hypothetical protein